VFVLAVTHVNLFTSFRYWAGENSPVANLVKVVTNFPKIKFIKGSNVPDAMAARIAMMFNVQVFLSAYVKMRFQT
jgi:hypothetical protein